jgi:hypothetical protein
VGAVRAPARIRDRASGTKSKTRRGAEIGLRTLWNEEDELLSPDANSVAILQSRGALHGTPVELGAIAAIEIFEGRVRPAQVDSDVSARKHGVVDRDVAHRATAEDDFIASEIDFL